MDWLLGGWGCRQTTQKATDIVYKIQRIIVRDQENQESGPGGCSPDSFCSSLPHVRNLPDIFFLITPSRLCRQPFFWSAHTTRLRGIM